MDPKITSAIDVLELELNCTKPASFRTVKYDDLALWLDALVIARSEIQATERETKLNHSLPGRELICYHNDITVCARYASTSIGKSCAVCEIQKKGRF